MLGLQQMRGKEAQHELAYAKRVRFLAHATPGDKYYSTWAQGPATPGSHLPTSGFQLCLSAWQLFVLLPLLLLL